MRIVGGSLRGRTLAAPRTSAIRPTTDRTRESLFNILAHGFEDLNSNTRVLDLFAGTGGVGLEAMSRGAAYGAFVEQHPEACGLLRANIGALGLSDHCVLLRRDATKLGKIGGIIPFNLVFADPPYAKGLGEKALISAQKGGWIQSDALVILEENRDVDPQPGLAFQLIETRHFGETTIRFYRFTA